MTLIKETKRGYLILKTTHRTRNEFIAWETRASKLFML